MLTALVLLASPLPSVSPAQEEVVRPVVVESLSHREAERIAGTPRLFRVVLDSSDDSHEGWVIYEVRGPDVAAHYTIWLPDDGSLVEDEFTAEARLKIIGHSASRLNPAFTEYRLYASSNRPKMP